MVSPKASSQGDLLGKCDDHQPSPSPPPSLCNSVDAIAGEPSSIKTPDWSKWAKITDLPPILFDYVIARVLDIIDLDAKARRLASHWLSEDTMEFSDPFHRPISTVLSLLCTSSRFHQAGCMALYEELYVPDDSRSFRRPPSRSKLNNVVRFPERYALFVKHLTVTPRPSPAPGNDAEDEASYFSYQPTVRFEYLAFGELVNFLGTLPRLRGIIWASNRLPSSTFLSLSKAIQQTRLLIVRPQHLQAGPLPPAAIGAASNAPVNLNRIDASSADEGSDSDASSGSQQDEPLRWNAHSIGSLHHVRELYLSHLSLEANRELVIGLEHLEQLERVTLDYDFVDDAVMMSLADCCIKLRDVSVRTCGTKLTERGVTALLEDSVALRSLTLSQVEGRLRRTLWPNLSSLPETFDSLSIALAEEGPHHSWVSNHITNVFDVLATAEGRLQSFCVSRLIPIEALEPPPEPGHSRTSSNALSLNLSEARPIGRVVPAIDVAVAPRTIPDGAIEAIQEYGRGLISLNIDFFTITDGDFKIIIDTCSKLQNLTVRLDAPLSKVLSMSSSFVRLTTLETLTLSITDINVPKKGIRKTSVNHVENPSTPVRPIGLSTMPSSDDMTPEMSMSRSTSTMQSPELSPSSTVASLAEVEEAVTPAHSPVAVRRFGRPQSKSFGDMSTDEVHVAAAQEIQVASTTATAGLPSQREIRKFSRRCPSLRILRLAGRTGLGEWHISKSAIEWYGRGSLPMQTGRLDCDAVFEASLARRRASGYAALAEEVAGVTLLKDDIDAGDVSDAYTDDPFAPIAPSSAKSVQQIEKFTIVPPRKVREEVNATPVPASPPSPSISKRLSETRRAPKTLSLPAAQQSVPENEAVNMKKAVPSSPPSARHGRQRQLSAASVSKPDDDGGEFQTVTHARRSGRNDDAAKRSLGSAANKKTEKDRGRYGGPVRSREGVRADASNTPRAQSPSLPLSVKNRNPLPRLRRDYSTDALGSPVAKTSPTPSNSSAVGPGPGGRVVPGFVPLDTEAGNSRHRRRNASISGFDDGVEEEDTLSKFRNIFDKSAGPGFVRKLRTAPKNVGRGGAASGANSKAKRK